MIRRINVFGGAPMCRVCLVLGFFLLLITLRFLLSHFYVVTVTILPPSLQQISLLLVRQTPLFFSFAVLPEKNRGVERRDPAPKCPQ